jgi:hypothetical protein
MEVIQVVQLDEYIPKFDSKEVIKALKSIKPENCIPREGATEAIYKMVNYPGETFFLSTDKSIRFFYYDNEDSIDLMKDQEPGWSIDVSENIVKIILLFKDGDHVVPVSFNFDITKDLYRNSLKLLLKKKGLRLILMSLAYGDFLVDAKKYYLIPDHIKKSLSGL